MRQNQRNAFENPKSPEARVLVVESLDGLAEDYLKGTCTNSFCEKWISSRMLVLPSRRMDADLGKSDLIEKITPQKRRVFAVWTITSNLHRGEKSIYGNIDDDWINDTNAQNNKHNNMFNVDANLKHVEHARGHTTEHFVSALWFVWSVVSLWCRPRLIPCTSHCGSRLKSHVCASFISRSSPMCHSHVEWLSLRPRPSTSHVLSLHHL